MGIASGCSIAAWRRAGLATLTHTPNPMGVLNPQCGRPAAEKPVLLLVVGYPKAGCKLPAHGSCEKPLEGIAAWL
jgi:iodotyrosine deiodinase